MFPESCELAQENSLGLWKICVNTSLYDSHKHGQDNPGFATSNNNERRAALGMEPLTYGL